ncbi:MAG: signal peptidase II [Clostridium sp.]|nr:signal peptidase II [Clostridium sp.]
MLYTGLGAGLFTADYMMKEKVERERPEKFPREVKGTNGKVYLYRNHNDGFLFGFLKDHKDLVKYVPLTLTSASAGIWLYQMSSDRAQAADKLGYTLVTAGALSNLTDRLKRGYVVDWLCIKEKGLDKVVFNLGDAGIATGAAILGVSALAGPRGEEKKQRKLAAQAAVAAGSMKASKKAIKAVRKAQKAMNAAELAAQYAAGKDTAELARTIAEKKKKSRARKLAAAGLLWKMHKKNTTKKK